MKGHLYAEQLKSMKRDALQALAKDMGVSAGGKNEEIIARIVAVEVDVPEEGELTEEEKTAVETARQEEERAAQQAAKEVEEKAATEQKDREDAAGMITVKAVTRFLDKRLNQIKDAGEAYSVSRERAEELTAAGVVEIMG